MNKYFNEFELIFMLFGYSNHVFSTFNHSTSISIAEYLVRMPSNFAVISLHSFWSIYENKENKFHYNSIGVSQSEVKRLNKLHVKCSFFCTNLPIRFFIFFFFFLIQWIIKMWFDDVYNGHCVQRIAHRLGIT